MIRILEISKYLHGSTDCKNVTRWTIPECPRLTPIQVEAVIMKIWKGWVLSKPTVHHLIASDWSATWAGLDTNGTSYSVARFQVSLQEYETYDEFMERRKT